VREVEPAHRGRGQHREILGQRHADLARAQQLEQRCLHGVVGARGVARCRTDAAVFLADHRDGVEGFGGGVAPQLAPHLPVQPLGEGLRQAIGERLQHDRAVVVLARLECDELPFDSQAGGDGESAHVIPDAGVLRRDEIGEAVVRLARRPRVLLPQVVPDERGVAARFVSVQLDVVTDRIRGQQNNHAIGNEPATLDDLPQHRLSLAIHGARRLADDGVVEDRRKRPGKLPRLEIRAPIDARRQLGEVDVAELAAARRARRRRT
jgi:hypothetical protein